MRVGRINAIKLVPYRDVKTLLRYFSIRGVAREAGREDDLANINTLQPNDNKSLNQRIGSRNSLNRIVSDTVEKRTLSDIEKNNGVYSNRASIEVIKSMRESRKRSKTSMLDMLAKSDIKSSMLGIKNDNMAAGVGDDYTQYILQQAEQKVSDTKENGTKEDDDNLIRKERVSSKTNEEDSPSLIEQYVQRLKALEKKEEENQQLI